MSTCNFSVKNAWGYYTLNEDNARDMDEIIDDCREMAKSREDGRRFYNLDCREAGMSFCRDAGHIFLGYSFDGRTLPDGVVASIDGHIMIRPGYYAGAVLDWDIELQIGCDRFYLSEYNGTDEMAEDAVGAWAWEAGKDGETEEEGEARGLLEKILDEAAATLDGICRDLCDMELRRVAVFSNGEAIYERV